LTEKREPGTSSPHTKLTNKKRQQEHNGPRLGFQHEFPQSHQDYDPLLLQKRNYIGKEEQTKIRITHVGISNVRQDGRHYFPIVAIVAIEIVSA